MDRQTRPLRTLAMAAAGIHWASLVELGRARAATHGEQPLYTFLSDRGTEDGTHLTFAGLDLRARAIGAALQRLGAGGQRALLLYPPGVEFVAAFFGCLYGGVVAVPAYPPRSARMLPRLLEIARDARPAVALTTAELEAAIGGLATQVPELAALRLLATDQVPSEQAASWSDPGLSGSSLAFLQYTSGSTAAPKGVMVSHGNLLHNEEMIRQAFGQTAESVIVGWLPLYHDMGLIGNVLQPLYLGARCTLMSPIAFLQSPKRWLAAISRCRATTSGGPNFAYDLCVRKIAAADRADLDLSSWDLAFNGAEPVRAETMARFAEAFAGCGFQARAFFSCYGLAEATLFVAGGAGAAAARLAPPRIGSFDRGLLEAGEARALPAADPASRTLVSCGRPWLGQELAIVDPATLNRCADGRVGEIWVRGASIAQGYWKHPEATAETFDGHIAADSGDAGRATASGAAGAAEPRAPFLRTGDLGFVEAGELFVAGRLKDLIIIRGRNLYPQDVELTVERSHPALRPGCGAAFSLELGEEERLVVVQELERAEGAAALPAEAVEAIAEAVRRAVAEEHEAQVQQLVLLRAGTIPKTSSGKLQRRACRAALLAGKLDVLGVSALGGPAPTSGPPALPAASPAASDPAPPANPAAPSTPATPSGSVAATSAAAALPSAPAALTVPASPAAPPPTAGPSSSTLLPASQSALAPPHAPATEAPPLAPALDRDALARLAEPARRAALESYLRERAAAVMELPLARFDVRTSLAALGLDSLYAVQLAHEVETGLGVTLPIGLLLEGPSLAELAADLAVMLGTSGAVAARADAAELAVAVAAEPAAVEVPLTYGQRALYFLDRLAPQSAAYVVAGAARVRGELDLEALRRALAALVERHPALRTTFAERSGAPVQTVHPSGTVELVIEEAAGNAAGVPPARLLAAAWRPFDLARGPLLRLTVFAASLPAATAPEMARDPWVVLAAHHLVADFWSLEVLLGELGVLYLGAARPAAGGAGPDALRKLPLSYADHARRQQAMLDGPRGEQLWEFWRRELAGPLPQLELPADRPRPRNQTFAGAAAPWLLPPAVVRPLRALAASQGATPFMALLAGFQALLARLGGQREVVVGAPVAGRDSADLAGLVGYFVNPVALRADLAADSGFGELLAATRRRVLAAFSHQEYPFPLLAERLHLRRDPSRSPIFQASLVLQKAHRPDRHGLGGFALGLAGSRLRLAGLDLESTALPRAASQFDVSLEASEEGEQIVGLLVYNRDLFDAATAARWTGNLAALLAAAAAEPAAPLSELPMLSAAERQQLLRFNATRRHLRRAAGEDASPAAAALDELVAAQAARTPDAIAVELDGESLTYQELGTRTGRLAAALAALGVGPESVVGIAAERSLAMVVGLLGILEAGAAYLPIDPSHPRERIAYMLADAAPRLLLADRRSAAALPEGGPRQLALDAFAAAPDGEGGPPPMPAPSRPELGPDRLAYVIYTSGSSGKPKAAMNDHRGIVNRLLWFQEVEPLTAADRVLQKTPYSFDVSVWELFWPLVTGARLVLARPGGHQDAGYLVRTIAERGITTAHFVPSMLQIFLEAPDLERCAALRRVLCSGEALGYEIQERFFDRLPGVALHNLYGPTETAVEVTHWRCRRGEGRRGVPIGHPIANVRIHLLDRHLNPVPVGAVGQLAIGGIAVGRGYLGRPDLTAERFVPDPFAGEEEPPATPAAAAAQAGAAAAGAGGRLYLSGDLARYLGDGAIEFLGRIDGQIKLRGVRIELGEIESVLASHPAVVAAAVAARGEGSDQRLVAYVVPRGSAAPTARELEEHLRRQLPASMVPAVFMTLASLPLTPSGKVDRRALPAPEAPAGSAEAAAQVPPGTGVEEVLAAIWCDVLKLERVGIYDDFFALGGHSLNANQVLARVREAFQIELAVPSLFESPTIAGLSQAIARELMAEADEETLSEVLSDL